jgi:hypothetical protein
MAAQIPEKLENLANTLIDYLNEPISFNFPSTYSYLKKGVSETPRFIFNIQTYKQGGMKIKDADFLNKFEYLSRSYPYPIVLPTGTNEDNNIVYKQWVCEYFGEDYYYGKNTMNRVVTYNRESKFPEWMGMEDIGFTVPVHVLNAVILGKKFDLMVGVEPVKYYTYKKGKYVTCKIETGNE